TAAQTPRPSSGVETQRPSSGVETQRPSSGVEATRPSSGVEATRPSSGVETPAASPLVGTPGGLHTLVDRLVADLRDRGVTVRTKSTVRALRRTDAGWELTVGPTIAPETVAADAVVLATAAAPTARLVTGLV